MGKMKIAIDLLPMTKEIAGVGVYIKNLLKYFGEMHPEIEFHLFLEKDSKNNFKYDFDNYFYHEYELPTKVQRILFEQTIFIKELHKYHIDTLFVPSAVKPIFWNKHSIVVIHDMAHYKTKYKYTFIRTMYIRIMTQVSALTSNCIITVSRSSKKDILEQWNIKEDKIKVIYNGLDEDKVDSNKLTVGRSLLEKYQIIDKYLLFVGTIESGKNLLNTIKAFQMLREKQDCDFQLVIVGKKTEYYLELVEYLEKSKISRYVIFTGFVNDDELSTLYRYAEMFICVSWYEGFGLPILEAMVHQLPVLTSNISSMPEIVGNNGCIVSPNNVGEIYVNLKKIIESQEYRNYLIKEQNKQVHKFVWKEAATSTLSLILNC